MAPSEPEVSAGTPAAGPAVPPAEPSLAAGPGGATAGGEFYGRPFVWLLFALAMLAIPLAGAMWRAGMSWEEIHPALNAALNATSTVFLVVGFAAIRRRQIALHRSCMIAAVSVSALFLVSYLARYAMTGTHRYPGDGWDKAVYLVILFSHMVLAAAVVPLVGRALWLAHRKRFADHARIARVLWPIWIYVSVTGVVVYLFLYQLAG
jgi:putative membrane protein